MELIRVERFLHGDYKRVSEIATTATTMQNKNEEKLLRFLFRAENFFLFPVHITNRHKRPRKAFITNTPNRTELMVKVIQCIEKSKSTGKKNTHTQEESKIIRTKKHNEKANWIYILHSQ